MAEEPTIISLDRSPSPPPVRIHHLSAWQEMCSGIRRARNDPALQSLCDVDLVVGGRTFKAHRILLAAASPVLARMFTNGMRETTSREVVLKELDADCFEVALDFVYSGQVELCCLDSAISLYAVSQRFQFDNLQKLLDDFIATKLNIRNTCTVVDLAENRNFPQLRNVALKKLESHFVDISSSTPFTHLSFDSIVQLCRSSSVMLQGEIQVFRAIAYWLDPSTKDRLFQDIPPNNNNTANANGNNNNNNNSNSNHEHDEVENASVILHLDNDVLTDDAESAVDEVEMSRSTADARKRCLHPLCITHRIRSDSADGNGNSNTNSNSNSAGNGNGNNSGGSGFNNGAVSSYTMARMGSYIPEEVHSEYANKLLALVRLDLMQDEDLKEIARFEWCKKYTQFYDRLLNIILKKSKPYSERVENRKIKSRSELKDSKKRVRFIEHAYPDFSRGRHRRRLQRSIFRNIDS